MRTASWLIAVIAWAGPATAQQPPAQPTQPVRVRYPDNYRRVVPEPQRRDGPLRYENITDIEIREIQLVAAKHVPKAIVNISPVVTGCPCEEGPQCTEQVYIVANGPVTSKGLQLSRVKNSWQVGVVQQWWLRYDALRARAKTMNYQAYEASTAELFREMPQCVGELVPAAAASNPPEVKK